MGNQASMGVKEHGPLGCASCCCLCLGFSLPTLMNYDIHGSVVGVSVTAGYTTGLWGTFSWSGDYDVGQGDGYTSNGFGECIEVAGSSDNGSCWFLTTQRLYTATFTFAMLALFASGAGMAMKMMNWVGAILHFIVVLLALCTVGYFTSKYSDSWGTGSVSVLGVTLTQDVYPSFSYVVLWFAIIGHLSAMGGSIMAALAKDDLDPADLEPATEEIGTDQAVTAKV